MKNMGVNRLTMLKIVELVITIVCLFLHHEEIHYTDHMSLLATVTFVGYTIILSILFLAFLTNNTINKRVDIFLSVIAIPLFTTIGVMIIRFWTSGIRASINTRGRQWAMWKGELSIVNAGLFLLDALLTFWA